MKTTSTPALTLQQFNAANIDLSKLGLNPANPAADRVKDALAALRASTPIKATKAPIGIRRATPGLSVAEAKELAQAISSSQLTQGVGIEGKKVALEVAVRLADALDAFHGYKDMIEAVDLDLSNINDYIDDRRWAATSRHIQQLVEQFAITARKNSMRQIDQEIVNLTDMLDQVDRIGGTALELFERRRMQREGKRPTAINKAIAEMKADGRIPMQQEGGTVA